jgi:hypothetical protein
MKTRAEIRQALLGNRPEFKTKVIKDANGFEYEVRQPSIRGRSDIRKSATTTDDKGNITFEPFDFMLRAAMACTFVPGTNELVFCDEDYDALVSMPAGSVIDELSQTAAEFCNVEGKVSDAKKS